LENVTSISGPPRARDDLAALGPLPFIRRAWIENPRLIRGEDEGWFWPGFRYVGRGWELWLTGWIPQSWGSPWRFRREFHPPKPDPWTT